MNEPSARVIALIDLLDLRRQAKQAGEAIGDDLAPTVDRIEAALAVLAPPESNVPPWLGTVYVYAPASGMTVVESGAPVGSAAVGGSGGADGAAGIVLRQQAAVPRACQACNRPCNHCQAAIKDPASRGRDNPIARALIEGARDDLYDWAVVVSTDLLLAPVVRHVQAHGRTIIHGCFPPVAADLTRVCWGSIDLRPIARSSASR